MNKKTWIISFLGVTFLAIGMELKAVFDADPNTLPWTSLIVDNIPAYISLPIIVFFAGWLVKHFYDKYKKE